MEPTPYVFDTIISRIVHCPADKRRVKERLRFKVLVEGNGVNRRYRRGQAAKIAAGNRLQVRVLAAVKAYEAKTGNKLGTDKDKTLTVAYRAYHKGVIDASTLKAMGGKP